MRRNEISINGVYRYYLLLLKARLSPALIGAALFLAPCCFEVFAIGAKDYLLEYGNVWSLMAEITRGVPDQTNTGMSIVISPEWLILQIAGIIAIGATPKWTSGDYQNLLIATTGTAYCYSIAEILWIATITIVRFGLGMALLSSLFVISEIGNGRLSPKRMLDYFSIGGLLESYCWHAVPMILAIGLGIAQTAIQSIAGSSAGVGLTGLYCIISSVFNNPVFIADVSMFCRFDGSEELAREQIMTAMFFLLSSALIYIHAQGRINHLPADG